MKTILAAAIAVLALAVAHAATAQGITLPHDDDAFSRLVARAEANDASVDFRALRFAWLDSAARKRAPDTRALAVQIGDIVRASGSADPAALKAGARKVKALAEQIISGDYADIGGHKFRRQACHILADAACEQHEHFVEFGLLTSITNGKDGKTPRTAWEVASVDEEYFIMGVEGWRPALQSLVKIGERLYDKLDVVDVSGGKLTLYFDITVMFPKEAGL